jgi:long-subunit fatty acid transport protein
MQKIIRLICYIVIAFPISVSGQNYINNPYSQYALGDLMNSGFSYNKSLGGSSVALRPVNQINYLNPASYTAQDTLSFLFQTGVSGQREGIFIGQLKENSSNINVEYIAMGFPITHWCKASLGLAPFSRTSYYYLEYQSDAQDVATEYRGTGGLNDFYIGAAFQPFKFLSVGFNAYYLFGNINEVRMIDVPDVTVAGTKITDNYNPGDLHYSFGLQYYPVIQDKKDRKHQIVFGAIYNVPVNINVDFNTSTFRNFPSHASNPILDTFNIVTDSTIQLNLPAKFGLGLLYNFNNKFMLSAEYTRQYFSKGIGMRNTMDLNDYTSYRFGAEFIPVPMSSRERARYFERMHYRVGGHYTNTYLKLDDTPIIDYGMSVGISLPWRNQQKLYTYTTFNLTYEYGVRGTTLNGLIKENYHMITLGVTLYDFWFMQPKYD